MLWKNVLFLLPRNDIIGPVGPGPQKPLSIAVEGLLSTVFDVLTKTQDLKKSQEYFPKQYQLHSRTFQSNEGWRGSEAIVVLQATLWKFYKQRVWDFQSNVQPSCIQATSSISSGSSSVGLVGGTNTCQFWHEGQSNPSAQCFANKFDLSWLYTLLRQSIHDTALIGSVDTPSTCRILWFFTRHFHPNIRK